MHKYIPPDKKSKRDKKAANDRQRLTWGGFNPVTRTKDSAKTYNRKKSKPITWHDHELVWIFLCKPSEAIRGQRNKRHNGCV